jgi:hypothetical protein
MHVKGFQGAPSRCVPLPPTDMPALACPDGASHTGDRRPPSRAHLVQHYSQAAPISLRKTRPNPTRLRLGLASWATSALPLEPDREWVVGIRVFGRPPHLPHAAASIRCNPLPPAWSTPITDPARMIWASVPTAILPRCLAGRLAGRCNLILRDVATLLTFSLPPPHPLYAWRMLLPTLTFASPPERRSDL